MGSIHDLFAKYPLLVDVLPAMGYSEQQTRELEETINAVPCDLVLIGTPFDLTRLVQTTHPTMRVTYSLDPVTASELEGILDSFLAK